MTPDDNLVLAISTDNRMLHVGPADAMLRHLAVAAHAPASVTPSAGSGKPYQLTLEYFDARGRRLAPPTGKRPFGAQLESHVRDDPQQVLLTRIGEGLDNLQRLLDEHPELGQQGSGLPVMTEVPRPEGSYPDVLGQLAQWFSPIDPRVTSTRGNWFHNLWHAATGG